MTIAGDLDVAICRAFDIPFPDERAYIAVREIFKTLLSPDFMTFYYQECDGLDINDFFGILDKLKTKVLWKDRPQ